MNNLIFHLKHKVLTTNLVVKFKYIFMKLIETKKTLLSNLCILDNVSSTYKKLLIIIQCLIKSFFVNRLV